MPLIALLIACAPSAGEAYRQALSGEDTLAIALDLCAQSGDLADECGAAVVRGRVEARAVDCAAIASETWRAECFFSVAERHAQARQRWDALRTCGEAGRYYHECLYHAWTYELQGAIVGGGRAADELAAAQEIVAFWGSIQTIAGDPAEQVWSDWWYFALNRNPPARLEDCQALSDDEGRRCDAGTRSFVARSVADFVQSPRTAPNLRDRLCRGNLATLRLVLGHLYESTPAPGAGPPADGETGSASVLDTLAEESRDRACPTTRASLDRPWNPIFLERRTWVAG